LEGAGFIHDHLKYFGDTTYFLTSTRQNT
jgi:hypothetical protein